MRIDDYSFGRIVIDGKVYTRDVIIYPDRVYSPWWRKEGHRLYVSDIEDVIKEKPEVLVVGCGAYGLLKIEEEVKLLLAKEKIELAAKPTDEACKIFNKLVLSRRTIACLHLTC